MLKVFFRFFFITYFLGSLAINSFGAPVPSSSGLSSSEKPSEIQGVGIDQKLGASFDLGIPFKDELGNELLLKDLFDGKKPVIISPVYYRCPGLCNFHLNGFVEALKSVDWTMGREFTYIALSFDPQDTAEDASRKKAAYVKMYGRTGSENSWKFLTGSPESVRRFTESIGFKYKWDEASKDWAHASAAVVFSPEGKITRYLPGILFEAQDIKLAINESAKGKVGTFVDSLILYCFRYDPHQSKYTLYAFNLMKMGGAFMVLLLFVWLLPVWFRTRKEGRI